ncbi:adenylate/guanylate cyclase domain-containing protein [Virgibacillus flavescens]|uniref:adenylate/guanylate cyclase domain-containing protein n=1 Tax=Virgibacillus flavescens TaxID=1611422 RepID=UPI003D350FE9
MGYKARRFVIEKEYNLPKEKIWEILSDTDNLNRFIGLFPVDFTPAKNKKKEVFHRIALAKVAGIIPLKWEESPFQWIKNEYYSVERHYLSGPLKHFVGGIELMDNKESNGTQVRLIGEFTPRNLLGVAVIPITGVGSMRNTMTYLDEFVKQKLSHPYMPFKSSKLKVELTNLETNEKKLAKMPIKAELIELLHKHIVTRPDQEVVNMRAGTLAGKWNADKTDTLRLFLYATKAGILNLNWTLVCPNCRVAKVEFNSLSNLSNDFHCDLCGVSYNADFENYVELKFSVNPSIRKAYENSYCVGGPMITPHVLVQRVVLPGETVVIPYPATTRSLQLRVLQANHKAELGNGSTDQTASIVYTDNGWIKPAYSRQVTIPIENHTDHSIVLAVEETNWDEEATTAAEVTAMQEFRDLFSAEVLAPGQQVGIENVTILFSDLEGSTSLYEEIGDANAYGQVRRHFDYLTQWISTFNGSIVKTIGDAVMAVFYRPEDGVNAALHIQKNMGKYNETSKKPIVLKIGLYSGPAIVVNSNNRLDYFGRTVNIAARIQNKSHGGDIVVHQSYFQNNTIYSLLNDNETSYEPFTAELKGIESKVNLMRIVKKTSSKLTETTKQG